MANLRNDLNTVDGIELDEVPMYHSETAGLPISELLKIPLGDEPLSSLTPEQPVSTNLKILHCPSCLITFSERTRSYFDKHIKICGKGTFPCFLCSKQFCSKTVLKRHLNSHLKINVFCCITCSSEFSTQFALKQHVEIVHNSEKSQINTCKCKYCGKEYKWASSLSRHIVEKHCLDDSSNTPMAFPCVCGQMFPTYYCSNKHKKSCDAYSKNIEENNVKVKQCPVAIKRGGDFVNRNRSTTGLHCKTVTGTGEMVASKVSAHQTGVNAMIEDDENMQTNQVDIHTCQLCNEEFSDRQDLEDHIDNCDPFDVPIGQDCLHAKMGIKRQSKTCVNGKEKEMGINNDAGESRNEDVYDSFDEIERLDTIYTDFVGKRQNKDDTVIAVRTKLKTKHKDFTDFETDPCTQTSKDVSTPNSMIKSEIGNFNQDNDIRADELYGENGLEMTEQEKCRHLSTCAMFYCPVCYKEDEDVKSMHDHIKEHNADQLVWSVLSKKYTQLAGVNIDPASLVADNQTVCRYCNADCQSTEELKLHLNRTHGKIVPILFTCSFVFEIGFYTCLGLEEN